MAFVKVTIYGKEQSIRVCDYCRATCIPHGRYCSGKCYRADKERIKAAADSLVQKLKESQADNGEGDNGIM